MKSVKHFFKWIWEQIDTIIALALGIIYSVLNIQGQVKIDVLSAATLAVLSILAFSLLRERDKRIRLEQSLNLISKRLDELIGYSQKLIADHFFSRQSDDTRIIKKATSELLLIQETGSLIIEKGKNEIVRLLNNKGSIKIVLCAPSEYSTHLLALRNASLRTHTALRGRYERFKDHIDDVLGKVGEGSENLEVRFIPYPIGSTFVIADPKSAVLAQREAIIRISGFKIPYEDKPDYTLTAETSPSLFSLHVQEFEKMFLASSKFVLVVGKTASGKTTILETLLSSLESSKHLPIYTVLSKSIEKASIRRGFQVRTSDNLNPIVFATKKTDGYDVKSVVWDNIAKSLNKAHLAGKILIVDELGPMQFLSKAFCNVISSIIEDPTASMIATIQEDDSLHPMITKIKRHFRTSLVHLSKNDNEHEVSSFLKKELHAAIETANLFQRSRW